MHPVERAAYFQEAIRANNDKPLELDTIQSLIKTYGPGTTTTEE